MLGGGTQNIFYYLAGKFLKIIYCLYSTIGLTKPNFDIKPKYLPKPDPNVPYTLHLKRQTYRMKIDNVKERKKNKRERVHHCNVLLLLLLLLVAENIKLGSIFPFPGKPGSAPW